MSRFRVLRCAFILLLAVLVGRLYQIQIRDVEHFGPHQVNLVKAAAEQQQKALPLFRRGDILDRTGRTLLAEPYPTLLLYPQLLKEEAPERLQRLAELLELDREIWKEWVSSEQAVLWLQHPGSRHALPLSPSQLVEVERMNLTGVTVAEYTSRYPEEGLAQHVIGYTAQDRNIYQRYAEELRAGLLSPNAPVGQAGLERTFEPFLQNFSGISPYRYTVDALGKPLPGASRPRQEEWSDTPLSVQTTLDAQVQRATEQALQWAGIRKGAAVVLDAHSGDILAMASLPRFDPHRPVPSEQNWNNLAVKRTVPGSIFKTVVAIAALEEGIGDVQRIFYCDGEWGRYGFSCWKEGGHGELTLMEAYAHSCNLVFAQLAMELGGERVEQYAQRLGLLERAGWHTDQLFELGDFAQIDGEEAGQVFAPQTPQEDEGVLIQTAIGQRDVQMSPLHAAKMVWMILHDGEAVYPRLVQSLLYPDGRPMTHFAPQRGGRAAFSASTAHAMREMMHMTVTEGTASSLADSSWPAAGKSGTAQVGGGLYNQWFVGFAPYHQPRYVVAVVNLEAEDGPSRAQLAFGHLIESLSRADHQPA